MLISQVDLGVSCLAPGLPQCWHASSQLPSLHLSLANFLPAILYPRPSCPPPPRSPCPALLLSTLSVVASVLRSQASDYAKLIKVHQSDAAKEPGRGRGLGGVARRSDGGWKREDQLGFNCEGESQRRTATSECITIFSLPIKKKTHINHDFNFWTHTFTHMLNVCTLPYIVNHSIP